MKLGTVVGEPTAMWDVYTGGGAMVDGTVVRLPFMRSPSGRPGRLTRRLVRCGWFPSPAY